MKTFDYISTDKNIGLNLIGLAGSKNGKAITIDEALLAVWDALVYFDVKNVKDNLRKKHVRSFKSVYDKSKVLARYRNYTREALYEALTKEHLDAIKEEDDVKAAILSDLKIIENINEDKTLVLNQTFVNSYQKIGEGKNCPSIEYGMMPYDGDATKTYSKTPKVKLTSYTMTEDVEAGLQPFIEDYVKNWDYAVSQEDYKWRATKHFQEKFNIGAENLSDNIKEATAETYNLLAGPYYFAKSMLCQMAAFAPDETRMALRNLFDESLPVTERVKSFILSTEDILKRGKADGVFKENDNSMQSERSISVYLALQNPTMHYIYQYSLYEGFKKVTEVNLPSLYSFDNKLAGYEMVCNSIREVLLKNEKLIALHNQSYPDDMSDYHLLTQDFLYYCVNYYGKENQ
ncbi:MAG: hypothetical protein KBT34_01695 [Prevotella sp.]|nr:hypothetical protein [Candidatus Prevotella equi]